MAQSIVYIPLQTCYFPRYGTTAMRPEFLRLPSYEFLSITEIRLSTDRKLPHDSPYEKQKDPDKKNVVRGRGRVPERKTSNVRR